VDRYIDKVTVFILCAVFFVQYRTDFYGDVPLIIIIFVSAFMSYVEEDRVRLAAALVYISAAIFYPDFVYFLPVVCCDIYYSRYGLAALAAVVPLVAGFAALPLLHFIFICLFAGLSFLMRRRTVMLDKLRSEYIECETARRSSRSGLSARIKN
jgi:hypothetical protein